MDKTVKSVLIDESLPVYKIVSAICQKIGLSNGMEYSLLPMPDKKRFNDDCNNANAWRAGISSVMFIKISN